MQEVTTPMMKQYMDIKKNYPDCLLFYRMGDFYELFMEDAFVGAKVLDITLTGKSNGKNERIPMAGVPFHAVDGYLAKLVKAGYKVAVCEQLSPPNKKGLVERAVVRIVTPGTVLDEKTLAKKENNYIVSIEIQDTTIAFSAADISTGHFQTTEMTTSTFEHILVNELAKLHPAECLLPDYLYNDPAILKLLQVHTGMNIYCYPQWEHFAGSAAAQLKKHFGTTSLAGFGIEKKYTAQRASAALLGYLQHTQQGTVSHIKKVLFVSPESDMQLDRASIINLELFSTIREHNTKGSLLSILDTTVTATGGRLLREWMRKPLVDRDSISQRHEVIETFIKYPSLSQAISEQLTMIADIERMLSRLSVGIGNARDLINIRGSLQSILNIKHVLKADRNSQQNSLLTHIQENISEEVTKTIAVITQTIKEEPGIDVRNGNLIKEGVDKELDVLRKKVALSKDWIVQLEKEERERSGIGSLKVRYNKVFGFYIEISKSNLHLIPDNYIRKQTLVNGERFITPELKEQEEIILSAEARIFDLEYALFQETVTAVIAYTSALQSAATQIAMLDILLSFAQLAQRNLYVRPTLVETGEILIEEGRHPVVETLLAQDKQFVPNTVKINNTDHQLLLITGPNMAGKSVLIRQTALIVLMNQIGCFVPAKAATLSIVDRIFVRSGASDVITSGLSTFMVEMVETAHILHHATSKSLIVMDEIGRGTSTYDGISIAWAVAEHLVTNTERPKTLFATHYHELQALEEEYPEKIKNYHMAVVEEDHQPVFLHTFSPGPASSSFGVAVAKLAGVPHNVIEKAKTMLHQLEQRSQKHTFTTREPYTYDEKHFQTEITNTTILNQMLQSELSRMDIHQMTPLEALNTLAALKEKMKLFASTSKEFIEAD